MARYQTTWTVNLSRNRKSLFCRMNTCGRWSTLLFLRADEGRELLSNRSNKANQNQGKPREMQCVNLIGSGKRLSRKVLKVLESDCFLRAESNAEEGREWFCPMGRCMLYRVGLYTLNDPVCVAFFLPFNSIIHFGFRCCGSDHIIIVSHMTLHVYLSTAQAIYAASVAITAPKYRLL